MAAADHRAGAEAVAPPPDGVDGTVDDRAMAVDGAALGLVAFAICGFGHQLRWMTLLVPAVVLGRLVAWHRLPPERRGHTLARELGLFALCLVIGAGNDWNSVVRHGIYQYRVPHYFPALSTIPIWMLLTWGLIVRSLITLCRWQRLAPPARPNDRIRGLDGRRPWLKVGLELALVLATRQAIYRLYADPVGSWLPFAAALALWVGLLRPTAHDGRVLAVVALVGPTAEILFIHLGGLHRYELGWLGGVPLWIALWWLLAALLVNDLAARLWWLQRGRRRGDGAGGAATGGPGSALDELASVELERAGRAEALEQRPVVGDQQDGAGEAG